MMIENELFSCLLPHFQKKLMDYAKILILQKGESLFFESYQAKNIFYVIKGHIKVFKTGQEGNETIFNIYPVNTFVALGVLFKNDKFYPASASAIEDSQVYALKIEDLEEAILADRESSKTWIIYMNNRLMTIQSMLTDQIFIDGMQRFKKLINYFYNNYPHRLYGNNIKIDIPITKQEMAELLNIRRETLSRMLSSLKNKNICEFTYKEIVVNKDWLLH